MASLSNLRNAMYEWAVRNGFASAPSAPPAGIFTGPFETRTTRTPGTFATPDVAGGDASVNNGVIKVDPSVALDPGTLSRLLRHEQVHQIFDTGGLGTEVSPLLDTGIKSSVATNPIYSGTTPVRQTDEALAYQLTNPVSKETELAQQIASILSQKGKDKEASQIVRLVR